jgi:hypothetical protein
MGLKRDELGFVRANGYGRIRRDELEQLLGVGPQESVYRSGIDHGVRTGQVVADKEVALKPGDTFSAGPRVVKGATLAPLPEALKREVDALSRAGFGVSACPSLQQRGGGCGCGD